MDKSYEMCMDYLKEKADKEEEESRGCNHTFPYMMYIPPGETRT
jgi:hypothetical protein